MNSRFLSIAVSLLIPALGAFAESPAVNVPPGPVESKTKHEPAPATPAPRQAKTKSAPGAQAPNGTNGKDQNGQPVTKAPNTPPNPAPVAAAAPAKKTGSVLNNYIAELNDTLKLTPDEKTVIQNYYLDDSNQLKSVLNDGSLSPLQQAQKVSDLRDARNDKIESLLQNPERRREFLRLEAKYRVALTEFMADGGA